MAGALSHDLLTGEHVRLWPYAPGVYGRDALYRLWRLMEDDGATKQAFWDEAHYESGADLVSFVKLFGGSNRLLLMIERIETGKLCGCFWVSQMTAGHQAFVGMWMRRGSRGSLSIESAQLALRYTFESGGFRQLWALTPWANAAVLCRQMGFHEIACLPEFCQWETGYKDIHMLRLTKEAFDGVHIS